MQIEGLLAPHAPWMDFVLAKLGTKETPGPISNRDIAEFHAHTRAGVPAGGDEVAWCASLAGWAFTKAGFLSTRSKAARSYATYGVELDEFRFGALYVFDRSDPKNPNAAHVTFGCFEHGGIAYCAGGNQGNMLSIKGYKLDGLIRRCWPNQLAA